MNDYHRRLDTAISNAGKHLRDLKRVSPQIFPEWQALQIAKANLKHARADLERAESAWKKLGNPSAAAAISSQNKGVE